jgi:hypothetical protein
MHFTCITVTFVIGYTVSRNAGPDAAFPPRCLTVVADG